MFIRDLFAIMIAVIQVLSIIWPVWLFLFAITVIRVAVKLYHAYRFRKVNMSKIDTYNGIEFEKYLAYLFKQLGYRVEETSAKNDFGADLVLTQAGERTVVQAKRYSNKVGVNAVQQVVAAKGYYQCSRAIVVTNNCFTKQAEKLAKANNVELWDRFELTNRLLTIGRAMPVNSVLDLNEQNEQLMRHHTKAQGNSKQDRTENLCQNCGKSISLNVQKYCEARPQLFNNKSYCMKCQPAIKVSRISVAT